MFFPHIINTKTYKVEKEKDVSSYAILSHRWEDDEIKFDMLKSVDLRHSPKIAGACQKAVEHDLDWLWVYSVCMDKDNGSETDRSLHSMFQWYRSAKVCLTCLWDVDLQASQSSPLDSCERRGEASEWFTRGWTLQELVAPPPNMEFYDRNWNFMGTKADLKRPLADVSGIDAEYLVGGMKFRDTSVATRISWMAGRCTRDVEDIAYSMLGILDVHMTAEYGEGVKAFVRLQKALMENSSDETLFAWTTCPKGLRCYSRSDPWQPDSWGLLAPSPDCFPRLVNISETPANEIEPRLGGGGYRWTQQGVQFQVPQRSGSDSTNWLGLARKNIKFALNCRMNSGGSSKTVVLHLTKDGALYKRVRCHELDPQTGVRPSSNRVMGIEQVITRPMTVMQPAFS